MRIALAALVCLWSSLPVTADEPAPVKSLLEMRRDRVVVQEWDLSCGAAALATILNYQHGDMVSEREIAQTLISRSAYIDNPRLVRVRHGFSLLDLKRYVEGRGYRGVGLGRMTVEDLAEHSPLIVPVNLHGYNHFVVFRGMHRDRVVLADPAWGNRTMTVERFEAAWLDYTEFGKIGFRVERADGLTPPNRLALSAHDFVLLR